MIDSYRFGMMKIRGTSYASDLVILPSRIISDWWRKRGHHLELTDITSFLDEIHETAVIGTGRFNMMKVSDELIHAMDERGITTIILPTSKAWKRFNELYDADSNITGMFHLTC